MVLRRSKFIKNFKRWQLEGRSILWCQHHHSLEELWCHKLLSRPKIWILTKILRQKNQYLMNYFRQCWLCVILWWWWLLLFTIYPFPCSSPCCRFPFAVFLSSLESSQVSSLVRCLVSYIARLPSYGKRIARLWSPAKIDSPASKITQHGHRTKHL